MPKYSLTKSYGVCVKLCNEQDNNTSEIQYVDPKYKNENTNFNLEVIQYHYASWFLLMGNMQIYQKLLGQELLNEDDIKNSETIKLNGNDYVMFDLFPYVFEFQFLNFWFYNFYRYRYKTYGIRKDILDVLMGKSRDMPTFKLKEENDYDDNQYELFGDGTIINGT